MTTLINRLTALCDQRDKTLVLGISNYNVALQDDSDGQGPYIVSWNVDDLGAAPTVEEGFSEHEIDRARSIHAGPLSAPSPSFIARDLIKWLSLDEYAAIRTFMAAHVQFALLWDSLLAQGEAPISVESARFQAGWEGIVAVLGDVRAAELLAAAIAGN